MKTYTWIVLGALVGLSSMLVGCKHPGQESATPRQTTSMSTLSDAEAEEPQPTQETFPAQFQATFYEVEGLAGRADSLNAKALEKEARTAESLLEALSKAGTARILYRFDQPVNVLSQSLSMSKNEPVITSTRRLPNGNAINSINYQQVGARVNLSAPASGGRRPEVTVAVELSVLAPNNVEITDGQKAPSTRTVSTEHQSALEFGQPRVMLAVDAASLDRNEPAVMYVIRYLFSR